MVKGAGIRDKFRSKALRELAQSKGTKRSRNADDEDESSEDEEQARLNEERMLSRASGIGQSLLSVLPKPKNASAFGSTIKLEKLLRMPEKAETADTIAQPEDNSAERLTEDGMVEVDVRKVVDDVHQNYVKELTIEKVKQNPVIIPRGKEKQKNQITYLAQLGKATELERKEQAAQGRINKAAARSKYGW